MKLVLPDSTFGLIVKTSNNLAWLVGCICSPFFFFKTHLKIYTPNYSNSLEPTTEAALKTKLKIYESLLSSQQDSNGFIHTQYDSGDSLLFTGLLGSVHPQNVKLEAAKAEDGQWFRRPLTYPPIYPGGARSTISRDMLIGLLWYIWRNKRLDLALELFDYGIDHNWVMGEGDQSSIWMVPSMQATLAEIIFRLGGPNHFIYRSIPQFYSENTDFLAHLDILMILLRQELTGVIDESTIISYQVTRQPNNPLFQYAANTIKNGDQESAAQLLLNTAWFPDNRLPKDSDRKEAWLQQRDFGPEWQPSENPSGTVWSGGDFLFIAKLILGDE